MSTEEEDEEEIYSDLQHRIGLLRKTKSADTLTKNVLNWRLQADIAAYFGIEEVLNLCTYALQVVPQTDQNYPLLLALHTVLHKETYLLSSWNWGNNHNFFLQQIHNRALLVGEDDLAAALAPLLADTDSATLLLNWFTRQPGQELHRRTLDNQGAAVKNICLTHDERYLVSIGEDRALKVWDWRTGELIHSWGGRLFNDLGSHSVQITNNDQFAIVADHEQIHVIGLVTGELLYTQKFNRDLGKLKLTPDSRYLIGLPSWGDKEIWVWNLEQRVFVARKKMEIDPLDIEPIPDTTYVVVKLGRYYEETAVARIVIWDWHKNELIQTRDFDVITIPLVNVLSEQTILIQLRQKIYIWNWQLNHFAPLEIDCEDRAKLGRVTTDQRYLVLATNDKSLEIWDLKNESMVRKYPSHEGEINDLAITADGSTMFSATEDGKIQVWATATSFERKHTIPNGHNEGIRLLGSIQDEGLLCSADGHDLKIWDPQTGQLIKDLPPDEYIYRGLLWVDLDDNTVVSYRLSHQYGGHYFEYWDTQDGQELTKKLKRQVKQRESFLEFLAMSRMGGKIVWNSPRYSYQLWRAFRTISRLKRNPLSGGGVKTKDLEIDFNPEFNQIRLIGPGESAAKAQWDVSVDESWDKIREIISTLFWNLHWRDYAMDPRFDSAKDEFFPSKLKVSPDRRFAAVSYANGIIRLFSLTTERIMSEFATGLSEAPRVWSFTADSQFLLIGNDKDQLEIWDWQQQKKDSELFKSRRGMTAVAVTKDNKSVIVGDYEGNIVLIDRNKPQETSYFRGGVRCHSPVGGDN